VTDDTGVGPAPPETVAMWVKVVASMGPTSSRTSSGARSRRGTARASATCGGPSSDVDGSSRSSVLPDNGLVVMVTHPGDAQWTEVVPVEYPEEAPDAPKPRRRGK
jgi:hypothetical protein